MAIPEPDEESCPPGPKRDLVEAFHALYRQAGTPGTRSMSRKIGEADEARAPVSHETLAKLLRGEAVPSWARVEAAVRYLASLSVHRPDPDATVRNFHALWEAVRHGLPGSMERRTSGSVAHDDFGGVTEQRYRQGTSEPTQTDEKATSDKNSSSDLTWTVERLQAEISELRRRQEHFTKGGPATHVVLNILQGGCSYPLATLTGHAKAVTSVAFSRDGRYLASGSNDHEVRLWDTSTHHQIDLPLKGHAGRVTSVSFSPQDNRLLGTAGYDGTIRLWDCDTRQQRGPSISTATVWSLAFSPDGEVLAAAVGPHTKVVLWNVKTREPIGVPLPTTFRKRGPVRMAFSPDSKMITATGMPSSRVGFWESATQHGVGNTLQGPMYYSNPLRSLLNRGIPAGFHAIDYSRDGSYVATGGDDWTVRLWNPVTRTQIGKPLTGHARRITCVAFSSEGLLASASRDKTVRLWNPITRECIGHPLVGHTKAVTTLAFSPDGRILATGSEDRTVRLWVLPTVGKS
ncbi:WD40 repeat domain-containing protein [Streptomyces sp. NPDC102462]|uniref:WD40 repeat domain-containing protein n=1 Tax=Streptomyces sp. NPDC102462 TaxID=3366178 RepID=UPI003818E88C